MTMTKAKTIKASNSCYLHNCQSLINIFAIIAPIAYLSIYVALHENSHIQIWDTLDVDIPLWKLLSDTQTAFSANGDIIDQLFQGVPRFALPPELSFTTLIYYSFDPLSAYIINKALFALVGYIGIYLLLRKLLTDLPSYSNILMLTASSFSILPFYCADMSVAAAPLLLYSLKNIYEKNNSYSSWLIIFLYPFVSTLWSTGFTLLAIAMLMALYTYSSNHRVEIRFILAVALLSMLYLVTNYRLLFGVIFNPGFIAHRVEFIDNGIPFSRSIVSAFQMLWRGDKHVQSLHSTIIIPSTAIGLYLCYKYGEHVTSMLISCAFLLISSFLYGLLQWHYLLPMLTKFYTFCPVHIERSYWLHPIFWYIAFGISLILVSKHLRFGEHLSIALAIIQLIVVFSHHENFTERHNPTYKQFFATNQFQKIKDYIGAPTSSYKVVSFGLYPAVALYNSFYTLDGYAPLYPLSYKHEFRAVIAPELEANEGFRSYYDNWGSRVYIFAGSLNGNIAMNTYSGEKVITAPKLNYEKLYSLGARYFISAVKLDTSRANQLSFERYFPHDSSCWDIYLYKLNPQ